MRASPKLGAKPVPSRQDEAAGALRQSRGEADLKVYRVHVPAEVNVQKIRKKLGLSQNEFASRFGIAPGTLRDWEQERKRPEGPARVLLMVIDKEPEAVRRALERARKPVAAGRKAPIAFME
jgi:putative transcriptional regulator